MEANREFDFEKPPLIETVIGFLGIIPKTSSQPGLQNKTYSNWDSKVDRTLRSWLEDPSLLDDGEIDPPCKTLIEDVNRLSNEKLRFQFPAPDRVLPNGNSGIAFEWDDGTDYACLEFKKDSSIEVIKTNGEKIIRQEVLS